MAKVIIGGETYNVPELNFIALQRGWHFVEIALATTHPMDQMGAAISVMAAGLCEAEDFDRSKYAVPEGMKDDDEIFEAVAHFLKKKLKATEIEGLRVSFDTVLQEAGLSPPPGEAPKTPPATEETRNPSTETVTDTSQNLLQPELKEEAGTQSESVGDSVAST